MLVVLLAGDFLVLFPMLKFAELMIVDSTNLEPKDQCQTLGHPQIHGNCDPCEGVAVRDPLEPMDCGPS
jgi:hypothetical protein